MDFNPLSPHGERLIEPSTRELYQSFQSTLPTRGETSSRGSTRSGPTNFNPLSPHGERLGLICPMLLVGQFQSTLPAWGETSRPYEVGQEVRFQSTLPAWGETYCQPWRGHCAADFNPLSPHGERPAYSFRYCPMCGAFQSTLPAWGETKHVIVVKLGMQFQSTLPAWGETAIMMPRRRSI